MPRDQPPSRDWQEQLVRFLIEAGTLGLTSKELQTKMAGRAKASVYKDLLDTLLEENMVQRFSYTVTGGTSTVTHWRATDAILNSPWV